MKIIFFGTDENASLVLKDLHISSHNILMAVTAPDKVRSRGTKKSPTPVKALCVDNKINYFGSLSFRIIGSFFQGIISLKTFV